MRVRVNATDLQRLSTTLKDVREHAAGAQTDFLNRVGADLVVRIQTDIRAEVFPGETAPITDTGAYANSIDYKITDEGRSLDVGVNPSSPAADYWKDVEYGQQFEIDDLPAIRVWAHRKFGGKDAENIIASIAGKAQRGWSSGERSIPQPALSKYVDLDPSGNVQDVSLHTMGIVDAHFESLANNIRYFIRNYKHAGRRVAYAVFDPQTGAFTGAQGVLSAEESAAFDERLLGTYRESPKGKELLSRRERRTRATRGRKMHRANPLGFGF